MKRVSAYQATDGTIFTDKEECKQYDRAEKIIAGVQAIADSINTDARFYSEDFGGHFLDSEYLVSFIIENGDGLLAALQGKYEVVAESDETVLERGLYEPEQQAA